jgi:hypothetical protein
MLTITNTHCINVKRFLSFKRNKPRDKHRNNTEVGIAPTTSSLNETKGIKLIIMLSDISSKKIGYSKITIKEVIRIKNPMMEKRIARKLS